MFCFRKNIFKKWFLNSGQHVGRGAGLGQHLARPCFKTCFQITFFAHARRGAGLGQHMRRPVVFDLFSGEGAAFGGAADGLQAW